MSRFDDDEDVTADDMLNRFLPLLRQKASELGAALN